MCSTTSPKAGGFDLIKVRKKDKAYAGTYDFNNLRVSGTYQSSLSALELEVGTLDEEAEVTSTLLSVYTKLRAGEHFRAKMKNGDLDLEIYCYFLPEMQSL